MKKLKKENKRKMRYSLKKRSKKIILHQIELQDTGITKEITTSFHTDPVSYGMIKEKISVPYSINARNIFY